MARAQLSGAYLLRQPAQNSVIDPAGSAERLAGLFARGLFRLAGVAKFPGVLSKGSRAIDKLSFA